mmetsp:Transcript_6846/g.12944  ORF Transcript_6846/g.12944 Transcript_6846/m.12944 type:complete len:217 (-) Transcript_6846:1714-2364(-)
MRQVLCCHLTGKRVWETGADGNEGNGGDQVGQAQAAAQERGQVPDDGGEDGNKDQRNEEGEPAAEDGRGWDEGEEELPHKADDVHNPVHYACFFLGLWATVAVHGLHKLLCPTVRPHLNRMCVHVGQNLVNIVFYNIITLDRDNGDAALGTTIGGLIEFKTPLWLCQDNPERFRLLIMLIVDDGNDNVALFLAGQEREGSLYSFVVFASNCSVILC